MATKITTGLIDSGAITSALITDASITADDLHTTLDLTGKTVTVATATAGDNDTSVASTAFVATAIANLADSAPSTLDTLNELAAALGDDANYATTTTNAIALKAPLASPAFNSGTANVVASFTSTDGTGAIQLADNAGNVELAAIGNDFHIQNAGSAAKMVVLNSGNVGIGNSAPATNLHIGSGTEGQNLGVKLNRGSTTNFFVASDGTKQAYIGVDNTEGHMKMGSLSNHPVQISQANASAIYIDTSKNVGIGTTSPTNKLEVSGGTEANVTMASDSGRSGFFITKPGTADVMGSGLLLESDETYRLGTASHYHMRMFQNGNTEILGDDDIGIQLKDGGEVVMPATSSLTIPSGTTAQRPSSPTNGMIRFNTTIDGIEEYRNSSWNKVSNIFSASGGNTTFNVTLSGITYKVHVFTSSGTFTPTVAGNVDVLVVAGGGAGNAAGGGAGGLVYTANQSVLAQAYTITVGSGGAAKQACAGNCGTNHGVNSTAFGITANKGMGANGWDIQASTTMNVYGSGAGSGHSSSGPYAESGYTTGQGHAGGAELVNSSPFPGSGGGGAGGKGGATSSNTVQGAGGLGLNYGTTFGTSVGDGGWFASGGVGSCHQSGCAAAYASPGGGGDNTGYNATNSNRNGLANTGGGGAGAHNGGTAGAGGSGVVIVRYAI
jgi:hypothetical protein